eukprot:15417948-Heterocapsa_arctica.AAC.1
MAARAAPVERPRLSAAPAPCCAPARLSASPPGAGPSPPLQAPLQRVLTPRAHPRPCCPLAPRSGRVARCQGPAPLEGAGPAS